jgi:hydroxyacylglutathione hydrolase
MIIETRAVPPFQKNGYVVACEKTRQAVVIDPGDEVDQLLQVVAGQSLDVRSILLTHAHVDHVTGVRRAKEELQAPVYLHRDDQLLYDAAPRQAAFFGLHCDELPPIDRYYDLAESLTFGEYDVGVHHTPGHCPGGVCLAIGRKDSEKEDLFVGDTLFAGSTGRTDVQLWRRRAGVLGSWPAHDNWPGAPHESVSAEVTVISKRSARAGPPTDGLLLSAPPS